MKAAMLYQEWKIQHSLLCATEALSVLPVGVEVQGQSVLPAEAKVLGPFVQPSMQVYTKTM